MALLKTERQHPVVVDIPYTYADLTSGVGVAVCKLPPGAMVIGGHIAVTTAFNSGTTAALKLGTAADDDAFGSVADAKTAGNTALTPLFVPLTATTNVLLTFTQTGTAATAGAGRVVIMYVSSGRADESFGS